LTGIKGTSNISLGDGHLEGTVEEEKAVILTRSCLGGRVWILDPGEDDILFVEKTTF